MDSDDILLDDQQTPQNAAHIHYKDFLQITSFVASVGIALAVTTAHSLASVVSYHGRSDDQTLAAADHSALMYTWSASVYGLALVLSLPGQVLETSPKFLKIYKSKPHHTWLRLAFKFMSWSSLGLVAAGTALVGEGLKLNSPRAGAMLQWSLLGVGSSTCGIWVSTRYQSQLQCIGNWLFSRYSERKQGSKKDHEKEPKKSSESNDTR